MGNDIKLPISEKQEAQQLNEKSKNEMQQQIIEEIDKISAAKDSTTKQIRQIESNLERLCHNIGYYETIIMDLSLKLDQIEREQINVNLAHDKYVEKSKEYANQLLKITSDNDKSEELVDEYSIDDIMELENQVILLNEEVERNEAIIGEKMANISS